MAEPLTAVPLPQTDLPRCDYRIEMPDSDRYYCRHSQVHAADHLVTASVCRSCTQHAEPCFMPRPRQWQPIASVPDSSSPAFISTQQLVADTLTLVGRLPSDLSAIAGIPRSGMLPASILATLLHLPLFSLCRQRGLIPIGHGKRLHEAQHSAGPLLVIDDSVNSGKAMWQARQTLLSAALQVAPLFAAVYCRPESIGCLDYYARLAPLPHLFEWNLCNCLQAKGIAFDFDGVLCDDFSGHEEHEEEYLAFLETARPRWLPRRHPVPLIVTARLEKYRPQTEAWLRRHRIEVRQLVMGPWRDLHERRRAFRAGPYKGAAYLATQCSLFIESDERQAAEIFEHTGRPVLCAASGRLFQQSPATPGDREAGLRPATSELSSAESTHGH